MSISSVSLLAVEKLSDFSPLFFTGVLEVLQNFLLKLNHTLDKVFFFLTKFLTSFQAIVAALLMNVYIVGLNQLSDIEIDKVAHV